IENQFQRAGLQGLGEHPLEIGRAAAVERADRPQHDDICKLFTLDDHDLLLCVRTAVAALFSLVRGASPLGLPDSLTRSPLRRLAPFVWLASLRSLAAC